MRDPVSALAELLVGARMKLGLTRQQLAKRFRSKRVTARAISGWENYESPIYPSMEMLPRVAKAYELGLELIQETRSRSIEALSEARRIRRESRVSLRGKADRDPAFGKFRFAKASLPIWAL